MNTLCTFYNHSTGEITGDGVIGKDTLEAYVNMGWSVLLDVQLSATTHYVDISHAQHGVAEYTEQERAVLAGLPHGWLWQMPERIAIDTRSLNDLKLLKNGEINTCRLTASRKSFMFAGKEIACDELSRSDIDGINGIVSLMQAMPINWVGGWKAMDNTYVVLPDVASWKQFYGAMVAKGQALFAHSQELKVSLLAATTAQQVTDIKWEA